MKKPILFFVLFSFSLFVYTQEIVKLPFEKSDIVSWKGDEKAYYSDIWQAQIVSNVSVPTMQVFKPSAANNNGTAVIVAPGGGFYAHSIETEGNEVARWLAKKGITAFVLKYRLVPTTGDAVAEITRLGSSNPNKIREEITKVLPLSVADGFSALAYVRKNAGKFGIDPKKVGFMGFSAGGALTMAIAYNYTEESRPDFFVTVYPWTTAMPVQKPKKDSPPLLIVCASDDPLGLAAGSVELYNSWHGEGLNAALHMYSKGGHGFGMRKKGLPSDKWIERFYEWSVAEGLVTQKK